MVAVIVMVSSKWFYSLLHRSTFLAVSITTTESDQTLLAASLQSAPRTATEPAEAFQTRSNSAAVWWRCRIAGVWPTVAAQRCTLILLKCYRDVKRPARCWCTVRWSNWSGLGEQVWEVGLKSRPRSKSEWLKTMFLLIVNIKNRY